jgi:hypothetical protein
LIYSISKNRVYEPNSDCQLAGKVKPHRKWNPPVAIHVPLSFTALCHRYATTRAEAQGLMQARPLKSGTEEKIESIKGEIIKSYYYRNWLITKIRKEINNLTE